MVTILKERRDFISPRRFGAKGDAVFLNSVSITSGAMAVTAASGTFSPSMVGKPIVLADADTGNTLLTTTVSSYTSSSQINIGVTSAYTKTTNAVVGSDDTAAIAAALAYATKASKAVVLDGRFLSAPIALPDNSALVGGGRTTSELMLKPGSASTTKYLLGSTTGDFTVEDLTLNGLKNYQRDVSTNLIYENIDLLSLNNSNTAGANTNIIRNLNIKNAGRCGLLYRAPPFTGKISDISIVNCGYGAEINSAYVSVNGLSVEGLGIGLIVKSYGGKFSDVHVTRAGYKILTGGSYGSGESASILLTSANGNSFVNCMVTESWATGWMLNSSNRNVFDTCAALDIGSAYAEVGLGSDNSAQRRAAVELISSNENSFDLRVNKERYATNYATHGLYVSGLAYNNYGALTTYSTTGAFATANIGGGATELRRNGVTVGEPQNELWYTKNGKGR